MSVLSIRTEIGRQFVFLIDNVPVTEERWLAAHDSMGISRPLMVSKTCKHCTHWRPNDVEIGGDGGTCSKATDLACELYRDTPVKATGDQGFGFAGGRWAYLHTGPDFGCVHWEENK